MAAVGQLIRLATSADAGVVAHHRAAMFHDMGLVPATAVPALEAASRVYLQAALARGDYVGWVVEHEGRVIAGGGALLRRLLPRPEHPEGGEEAYLLNVYTEPEHRRHGVARRLMEVILEWCRARQINRVSLHASDDGRPLYESLGFAQTNEMRVELR